jgi:hypothetical protein
MSLNYNLLGESNEKKAICFLCVLVCSSRFFRHSYGLHTLGRDPGAVALSRVVVSARHQTLTRRPARMKKRPKIRRRVYICQLDQGTAGSYKARADIVVTPGYYNMSNYIENVAANSIESWNKAPSLRSLRDCYDGYEIVIQNTNDSI